MLSAVTPSRGIGPAASPLIAPEGGGIDYVVGQGSTDAAGRRVIDGFDDFDDFGGGA